MKTFTTAFILSNLALLTYAQGTQFITGPCNADSDCASACCGFNSGLCAGPVIAQTRDGGCGHGNATPNANAAIALGFTDVAASGVPAATPPPAVAPVASAPAAASTDFTNPTDAGNGVGSQFITGACTSDADCASGCCGFNTGLCAGAVIAQTRDGGCGFGNASPNNNAALALGSTVAAPGVSAAAAPPAAATSAAATSTEADSAGDENVGNGEGKQFITGKCDSDADCASTCCASGLCSAIAVAAAKGGCGFVARKREFWA